MFIWLTALEIETPCNEKHEIKSLGVEGISKVARGAFLSHNMIITFCDVELKKGGDPVLA